MALKVVFAQDLSGSFGDDIANVRTIVPEIVREIRSYDAGAELAITSFVDKPVSPFGSLGDYVYNTDIALTSNAELLTSTYNGFAIRSGADGDEAQLEALLQIALRETEIGWSNNDPRVVVLFTDAGFHEEGDHPGTVNNYDDILNGIPAGTGEDYPAIADLGFLLRQKKITPIFAVTEPNKTTYESLVTDLSAGGGVVTLSSDSSNIVESVKNAVRKSSGLEHLSPLSGISFREDETYNLRIRLNQQPTSDVVLTAQTSNIQQAIINDGSLHFTADNWNQYQIIAINGIDDTETEINQKLSIEFSAFSSDDANFNGYTPASIFFTLTDNELTPVSAGSTIKATTASSVELNKNSTFTPSEESDTIKFSSSEAATVKGTPKELRDDIIYNFNNNSDLKVVIPKETLASIKNTDLSKHFKITQGSSVIQFDANFDDDFNDIEDTIFTLKGKYKKKKFSFVKSPSSKKVEISYTGPSPHSTPESTDSPDNCIAGLCSTSHKNGVIEIKESKAKNLNIKHEGSTTKLSSKSRVPNLNATIKKHIITNGDTFTKSTFKLSPKRKPTLTIRNTLLSKCKIKAAGKENKITLSSEITHSTKITGAEGKETVYITEGTTLTGSSTASLGDNTDQVIIDGIIHKLKINNGRDSSKDMIKISNSKNIKNKLTISDFGKEDRLILESSVFMHSDLATQAVKKELKELGIVVELLDQ